MAKKIVGTLFNGTTQYNIIEYSLDKFIEEFSVKEGDPSRRTNFFLDKVKTFSIDPKGVAYTVECEKSPGFVRNFFPTLEEALLHTVRNYIKLG